MTTMAAKARSMVCTPRCCSRPNSTLVLVFLSLVVAIPSAARSQVVSEAVAIDSLRARVGARGADTVFVERTYQRGFFPAATFFRTRFLPSSLVHYPVRSAAAVVVDTALVVVQTLDEAERAWRVALGSEALSSELFRFACYEFLVHVGILSDRSRAISVAEEIPRSARTALHPQAALRALQPAKVSEQGVWLMATSAVWDQQLLSITCAVAAGGGAKFQIDTLARFR